MPFATHMLALRKQDIIPPPPKKRTKKKRTKRKTKAGRCISKCTLLPKEIHGNCKMGGMELGAGVGVGMGSLTHFCVICRVVMDFWGW